MKKSFLYIIVSIIVGFSKQIEPTTTDLMTQYFFDLQKDSIIPGISEEMNNIIRNNVTIESVRQHSSLFLTILFNTVGFKYSYIESGFSDTLSLYRETRCTDSSVNNILFSMLDYPCYATNSYYACRTFNREPGNMVLNGRGLNNSDNLTYLVIKKIYEYPNFQEFNNRKREIKERVRNIRWSNIAPYTALDSIRLLALTPLDSTEQARLLPSLIKFDQQIEHDNIEDWVYIRLGDTEKEDAFLNRFLSYTPSHSINLELFNTMITHTSIINTNRSMNALLYQFLHFERAGFSESRYFFMEGLDRNFQGLEGYDNYFHNISMIDSEDSERSDAVFAEFLQWIYATFDISKLLH